MEAGLLAARVLLVAVLGLAGVTKLVDRAGTTTALRDFGIPEPLVRPLAIALPVAELLIAGALIPAATAGGAAAVAAALTVAFIAVVARTVARGKRPDCRCFGPLTAAPVGWSTVARDGGLLVLAGFVAAGALNGVTPSPTAAQTAVIAGALATLGIVGFGAWVVVGLVRQQGRLLLRIEALEQARWREPVVPTIPVAEDFSVPDHAGRTVDLAELRARGRPVVLVFTDRACGACADLEPDVARWTEEDADRITVATLRGHGDIRAAFGVEATPSAVLITPTGLIASPVVSGVDAVRSLVAHVLSVVELQAAAPHAHAHAHG